jgi:FKBP-type peptidyl-prolyl cis-trans isomerase 2
MEDSKGEHHSSYARHPKKKISWKKIGIVLGILIILVGAYFLITALINKPKTNVTVSSLKIDYTLKLDDGTIIAENISSFKPGKVSTFFGLASDKLDKAIAGLKEGASATIELEPADAFGEYNESNIIVMNRTEEINRTVEVPLDAVKQTFNEDPVIGKNYTREGDPFEYKVLNVSIDMVTLSLEADIGKSFESQSMSVNVTKVTDDKVYLMWTPEKGASVLLLGFFPATVKDYNETSIIFDLNNPYAGKKIIAEIKVVEITKKAAATTSGSNETVKKIEGAPTLQTFVMSYCPYGTQMEKGIIPVYKLLKDKANFEIRFVSYTMHGEKEDTENKRQVCIREEQPSKFWDYLECFLDAGDAAGCVSDVGLDNAKLTDCMSSRADDYWQTDKDLNTQYGVQGSPTNVLDGEVTEIYPRSPEDVKKAVCAVFASEPSECSQTLDTANPSAGFGSGTSSSGSAGGCGA